MSLTSFFNSRFANVHSSEQETAVTIAVGGNSPQVIYRRPVAVTKLPQDMALDLAHQFFREVAPLLNFDRPYLVFDLSEVRYLDSNGIQVLQRCLGHVIKRGGDLKLAAIPPPLLPILEWAKVARLFQIFESPADAVESFHHSTRAA
jgi:anti-sigma B factor antagonist